MVLSAAALILAVTLGIAGEYTFMGAAAVTLFSLLGLYFHTRAPLKTFTFTCWVFAFFSAGLVFPHLFQEIGGFSQSKLIVPLIQIIMFGMGATLSLQDFARAIKMPKAVGLGMLMQFTVMPVSGLLLIGICFWAASAAEVRVVY